MEYVKDPITGGELIMELQACDPDAPVGLYCSDDNIFLQAILVHRDVEVDVLRAGRHGMTIRLKGVGIS